MRSMIAAESPAARSRRVSLRNGLEAFALSPGPGPSRCRNLPLAL